MLTWSTGRCGGRQGAECGVPVGRGRARDASTDGPFVPQHPSSGHRNARAGGFGRGDGRPPGNGSR